MKKLLILILCLGGTYALAQTVPVQQPVPQQAQKPAQKGTSVRLNGYATYAFDDNHVDSYYSETSYFSGAVKGGFEYGGGLEILPFPAVGAEFLYLRLDSKAPMEYYDNGAQNSELKLAQNFIMLSINKYLEVNPKVEPYAGMQLGMDVINVENPRNNKTASATKFAWGIKAGLNIWASEKVGIKMQASLLSAVQAIGGGVFFGTGGASAGVSGFSSYYQFNLGGGLVFKLK
jgi:hypothetical protein